MNYDFSQMTLTQLNHKFPDERACMDYVVAAEYPEGHVCVKCGRNSRDSKMYRSGNRPKAYMCYCGRQWSPMAETIFNKTSLPLKSWFIAFWVIGRDPSKQNVRTLSRVLGITYKTAWRVAEIVNIQYNPHYRLDHQLYRGIEKSLNGRYRMRTKKDGVTIRHTYNTLDEARDAYLRTRYKLDNA